MKHLLLFLAIILPNVLQNAQAQDTVFRSTVQDVLNVPISKSTWQDISITSASRSEENASKAPATTRVVTEEQIKARCYRSLGDVLRDLPDIKLNEMLNELVGGMASFRGILGNSNFVILLDGVRISSPTNEDIPIMENFPLNMVKQVEVVYGASSALYGADALAGIII